MTKRVLSAPWIERIDTVRTRLLLMVVTTTVVAIVWGRNFSLGFAAGAILLASLSSIIRIGVNICIGTRNLVALAHDSLVVRAYDSLVGSRVVSHVLNHAWRFERAVRRIFGKHQIAGSVVIFSVLTMATGVAFGPWSVVTSCAVLILLGFVAIVLDKEMDGPAKLFAFILAFFGSAILFLVTIAGTYLLASWLGLATKPLHGLLEYWPLSLIVGPLVVFFYATVADDDELNELSRFFGFELNAQGRVQPITASVPVESVAAVDDEIPVERLQ